LSVGLAERFFSDIQLEIGTVTIPGVDRFETLAHYGPELGASLVGLEEFAGKRANDSEARTESVHKVVPIAALPQVATDLAEKAFSDVAGIEDLDDRTRPYQVATDFLEIFSSLYDRGERTLRNAARVNKQVQLPILFPTERLRKGLAWVQISDHLVSAFELEDSLATAQELTLLLDVCNDLGIVVPITCESDGVVFRGFRHGETAPLAENELILCYHAISAFISKNNALSKKSGPGSVSSLVLEKLLTLLFRIGTANDFIEALHGPNGMAETIELRFHLRGALQVRSYHNDTGDPATEWLSRFLTRRGVLHLQGNSPRTSSEVSVEPSDGGTYRLGECPPGVLWERNGDTLAKHVGQLVATLQRTKERPDAPLDNEALIILATCVSTVDVLGALNAELSLVRDWLNEERGGFSSLQSINLLHAKTDLTKVARSLRNSVAYEAATSGLMKFRAYRDGEHPALVAACADYLEQEPGGEFQADTWRRFWQKVIVGEFHERENLFRPLVDESARLCWQIAAGLIVAELGVETLLAQGRPRHGRAGLEKAIGKLEQLDAMMLSFKNNRPAIVETVFSELRSLRETPPALFVPGPTWQLGLAQVARVHDERSIVRQIMANRETLRNYGRLKGMFEYEVLVWYDIAHSTSADLDQIGTGREDHRTAVSSYTTMVDTLIEESKRRARVQQREIFVSRSPQWSKDDERHIFFRGQGVIQSVEEVLADIHGALKGSANVAVRILVIRCSFGGNNATRYEKEADIGGQQFWEEVQSIKESLKDIHKSGQPTLSYVAMASDVFKEPFGFPAPCVWEAQPGELIAQVESRTYAIPVLSGYLRPHG
jgi:hypothetical protein